MSDSQGVITAEESQETRSASSACSQEGPGDTSAAAAAVVKKKKKPGQKKAKLPVFTTRDETPRRPYPARDSSSFTVLSWNVNGIRATAKYGLETLRDMVKKERPDLVCFQETKIQEKDTEQEKLGLRDLLPGYYSEWNCSSAKLGYSGTAVFFPRQDEEWETRGGAKGLSGNGGSVSSEPARKKAKQGKIASYFSAKPDQKKPSMGPTAAAAAAAEEAEGGESAVAPPSSMAGGRSGLKVLGVRFGIGGGAKHNNEGRAITVEYEKFFVVTVYVPNSGDKLQRLDYRTKEWDPALRAYVKSLEKKKPVVLNGDLNVAHQDLDVYNRGAPHLPKSSATTKEERESFGRWMQELQFADAFRQFHPDADGAYTYWSVRTGARPVNRGLRLDYFVCSTSLFEKKGDGEKEDEDGVNASALVVHDCFILDKATVGLSDHCPIGITLRWT